MNIKEYGLINEPEKSGDLIPVRITACRKNKFEFVSEMGEGLARLKTREYFIDEEIYPTTGDFVMLQFRTDGERIIYKTLPRKTCFKRLDPSSGGKGAQAVAANFDYVFIMQSFNGNFNTGRLERYLTLSWESGAVPVVVLTKADLCGCVEMKISEAKEASIGAEVIAVSSKTGYGTDKLSQYLQAGKTVVFLGSSGVGKSGLVNFLSGEELMDVGGIREKDSRGRHTTTHRQLIRLESGVMIIDTPGMRELGMWDAAEGLEQSFNDVERYFGKCRFSDCRHESEPDCAVKAAIERGELSKERWESYKKLKWESSFSEGKGDYLAEKYKRNKRIAKQIKSMKRLGEIKR